MYMIHDCSQEAISFKLVMKIVFDTISEDVAQIW